MSEEFSFPIKSLVATVIFAIAMAFIEASIVVYLRALYYPEGFSFPVKMIPLSIYLIEVIREVATIIMLIVIGWLSAKRFLARFAGFIIAFGIWDIFYYVFLKLTINWPSSLLDWDILFLIPLPWVGPVLAPIIVSFCLLFAGVIIWNQEAKNLPLVVSKWNLLLLCLSGLIIVGSFLTNVKKIIEGAMPAPFHWEIFILGLLIELGTFIYILKRTFH